MILENKNEIKNNFPDVTSDEADVIEKELFLEIVAAMRDGGYNPVTQIVGYIVSGDPTHIPNYNNARTLIGKIDKDDLLERIVGFYIDHLEQENNED